MSCGCGPERPAGFLPKAEAGPIAGPATPLAAPLIFYTSRFGAPTKSPTAFAACEEPDNLPTLTAATDTPRQRDESAIRRSIFQQNRITFCDCGLS
jgi:hypothetical protein